MAWSGPYCSMGEYMTKLGNGDMSKPVKNCFRMGRKTQNKGYAHPVEYSHEMIKEDLQLKIIINYYVPQLV